MVCYDWAFCPYGHFAVLFMAYLGFGSFQWYETSDLHIILIVDRDPINSMSYKHNKKLNMVIIIF